jgi:hypothetical protein
MLPSMSSTSRATNGVAKTLKDLFLLLRGNNFVPFFFFFQKIIYAVDIVWNYFVLVDFVVLEFIWLYL